MTQAKVPSDAVATVRRFNRFYTNRMGFLAEGLLNSPFTLTEARILYELAHRDGLTATDIGRDLGLDAGYLSRILKSFETQGLIVRTRTDQDGRQRVLALTAAGRTAFAPLDAASHQEIGKLLRDLGPADAGEMVAAMRMIQRILGGASDRRPDDVTLRGPVLGDIGWITHRQALLYQREYGWDQKFEVLVAEIFAEMMQDFDTAMERGWIAELDHAVIGSVFVVRQSDTVAKLRLLYVEPHARGLGLGRRLVRECIAFARDKRYRRLTLWTNDVLKPARRIYVETGFHMTSAEAVRAFGQDMVSETWELDLTAGAADLANA